MHNTPFSKIISLENLFLSWREFRRGKRGKPDVQIFERHLEDNLFQLYHDLKNNTYRHFDYIAFCIQDPKMRRIHKAIVRDRIVHHAVYRILYPVFDKSFIFDSYSCRIGKGTHRAVSRLEKFTRQVSKNYTKSCWALKCDVKKFFNSVEHRILFKLIKQRIANLDVLDLIWQIISSFSTKIQRELTGIPLGNLISQVFANTYLNEFDQFIKHQLKIRYYLRYCDDFVILDQDPKCLTKLISPIQEFLKRELKLTLHPDKIIVRKLKQGVDFLGYVVLPHYRILRTKTKKRMLKRVNQNNLASYLGLLQHCCGYKLKQKILKSAD